MLLQKFGDNLGPRKTYLQTVEASRRDVQDHSKVAYLNYIQSRIPEEVKGDHLHSIASRTEVLIAELLRSASRSNARLRRASL